MRFSNSNGALFKGQKKSEKAPDYNGNVELDAEAVKYLVAQIKSGVEKPKLELSGWLKTAKTGNKWISLGVGTPYEKTAKAPPPKPRVSFDPDDEIPF